MKKMWWLVSLAIVLLSPTFVSADCASLGRFTHWILETSHAVIFYERDKPLARIEIPYCEITPSSKVLLLNSYVCESDEIVVNSVACRIITVQLLE